MKSNEGQQLKFLASYTVYVDIGIFQTTNKTVFASQGFSGLGFMTFRKWVKPIGTYIYFVNMIFLICLYLCITKPLQKLRFGAYKTGLSPPVTLC